MLPGARFAAFQSVVFSRPSAILAAVLALLIVAGCMSLNIGGNSDENGALVQTGTVSVPANAELEVYYPVPYAGPPNLEIEDWHQDCVITEQKDNHFRIRNNHGSWSRNVSWKARGLRVPPAVIVNPPPQRDPLEVPVSGPQDTAPVQMGQPR
jgi:hypothetical protein